MDLPTIERLMQLMTKHRISCVEVEGMRLTKNLHTATEPRPARAKTKPTGNRVQLHTDSEEAILFGATAAPQIDPALFSANGFRQ